MNLVLSSVIKSIINVIKQFIYDTTLLSFSVTCSLLVSYFSPVSSTKLTRLRAYFNTEINALLFHFNLQ